MKCLASVIMVTYNHEDYIEEAIKGVLMQKTNFDFELIVANDCSPDNTDKIVKKILQTHISKNKVNYINHSHNIGMTPNFISALEASNGRYIAFCEGDDYWTDSLKLQKQVDFLENNPNFNICFHPVQRVDDKGNLKDVTNKKTQEIPSVEDLIRNNFIYTASSVTRKEAWPNPLPEWYFKMPIGDWPLHLLAASKGKIKMLPDVMAAYRQHEGGVWTQKKKLEIDYYWGKGILKIYKNFDKKYHQKFLKVAAKKFSILLRYNLNAKKPYHLLESIKLYYLTSFHRPWYHLFSPIKWLVGFKKN